MMPTLCAIKELKANLDASWNTKGDKFCVGAASGHVFIGSFNAQNGFWIAPSQTNDKPLHKASVLCVRFDPSGRVVASASADGTVIISTCYDEAIDTESTGPFANVTTDAEMLFKFTTSGWVNSLSFSPSGSTLVFVCKSLASLSRIFDFNSLC